MARSFAVFVALFCAACSSSTPAPAPAVDAGPGPSQPAGAKCDPTLGAQACEAPVNPCTTAVCDATEQACLIVTSDAGGCSVGQPTCQTSADCGTGVCVTGLCYQSCLSAGDCDGGACMQYCSTPPGCGEDACAQTCTSYCSAGTGL